jgi:hypothetical protein
MADEKPPQHEFKRGRGRLNRVLEKVNSIPDNVLYGGAVSDARKRDLWEKGIEGTATITKAPTERSVSAVQTNVGTFRARIEVPGREPYDVKVKQSYGRGDWERLHEGAVVECRIDREDPALVLLVPPESDELGVMDSAGILSEGRRATAKVIESKPLGQKTPDGLDEFHLIALELRTPDEPEPWRVAVGQRVPGGAEGLLAEGSELEVAFLEVDEGDSVAVDWPSSTGGRFS